MSAMTFEQFQATGRDVPDLRDCEDSSIWDAYEFATRRVPGRVYAGNAYIERQGDRWYCQIANTEMVDANRAKVERFLYDWALSEGYFDGQITQDVRS
jgi:hypothetical protein